VEQITRKLVGVLERTPEVTVKSIVKRRDEWIGQRNSARRHTTQLWKERIVGEGQGEEYIQTDNKEGGLEDAIRTRE